jgi:hypothetical protein
MGCRADFAANRLLTSPDLRSPTPDPFASIVIDSCGGKSTLACNPARGPVSMKAAQGEFGPLRPTKLVCAASDHARDRQRQFGSAQRVVGECHSLLLARARRRLQAVFWSTIISPAIDWGQRRGQRCRYGYYVSEPVSVFLVNRLGAADRGTDTNCADE